MKTLIKTETNISKYLFNDGDEVVLGSETTTTPTFIIADLNESNAKLYSDVTPPEDWVGTKYFFDGTTWTQNPDWVDPTTLEDKANV